MIACVVAPVDQRYELAGDEVSVTLPPAQNVVGPLGVIAGAAGFALTTTEVDPAGEVQPLTVMLTV